ncbi:baeRF7 domain-containing protein [Pleomorphovibrio marinus]|uniref:baeRF7 domain-containing protein n=1 Tax=Pleomorphovibrio marinus TaxID=2164132 RepID=UPI000E0B476C|nr:hypothetical protein [Pleomorphovibrio marinus]
MKIFNNQHFKKLHETTGNTVLSFFVPTNRHSSDGYKADKIHLKNLLGKAQEELVKLKGMEEKDARETLKPASALLEDYDFWKYNADLLAIYIIDGDLEYLRLPIPQKESAYFIGQRPFLLPLIPELNDDGLYYLLLLNLDRIRLFEAKRSSIYEIELDQEEVAVSFTDEEEEMENVGNLQAQSNVGDGGATYHGHGDGSDEEKKVTILNYFHRMTNMLEPKLNQRPLPLFLAGVDYLIPLFREASKYNHLQKGHVSGAFSGEDIKTLHKKSWELASRHFDENREGRMEEFNLKKAKSLAIDNDSAKLIKASISGGVDMLFLSTDHEHKWGTFNEEQYKLNFEDCPTGKNHCLIDLAASHVVNNGGKVYFLPADKMPAESQMAGTLRYEI